LSYRIFCFIGAAGLLFSAAVATAAGQAQHVILDTDMGNDVDDPLALAMLHAFESRGEVKLLAVTVSKGNPWAAEYVRMVNEFYGRGAIPVGLVRDGKTADDGRYVRAVCEKHGRKPGGGVADAVALLKSTLSSEADGAVTVIQIGFSTNLAGLLQSPGGVDLVRHKVRRLYLMAGNFQRDQPEYNVFTDIPAAREVFSQWPTEMVFSGFEIGERILFPARSIEHDFAANNPVAEAYPLYEKMPYDRPTWDLTAVLADLRPDRGYFDMSEAGDVTVKDNGTTVFSANSGGRCRYLKISGDQSARVREALVWLSSQPK
jgi:purine nucleosidase